MGLFAAALFAGAGLVAAGPDNSPSVDALREENARLKAQIEQLVAEIDELGAALDEALGNKPVAQVGERIGDAEVGDGDKLMRGLYAEAMRTGGWPRRPNPNAERDAANLVTWCIRRTPRLQG